MSINVLRLRESIERFEQERNKLLREVYAVAIKETAQDYRLGFIDKEEYDVLVSEYRVRLSNER
ncbi:hypothetical protein [Endozoicomonas sp. 4G]|uniref:hypothetical protein n=1 Tax=Endozoicomonas sp. 4G TaxID=2872754 RepID=UPI0020785DE3|nr:hypothetical protein [Endozoicomonas sp. 4G]